jgi:hypothetical protein
LSARSKRSTSTPGASGRGQTQERTLGGKGMRETEEKGGWAKNKPVGRDELGRVHDEGDPREANDEKLPSTSGNHRRRQGT